MTENSMKNDPNKNSEALSPDLAKGLASGPAKDQGENSTEKIEAAEKPKDPVFRMDSLSFRYPMADTPALKGIDLALAKGEVLLLAGPSGGGKSTIIRLLNGLAVHHYHGELKGDFKVLGRDHAQKSLFMISSEVASVFQNPESQFFGLNPKDEMLLAWECRGIPKDVAKDFLDQWKRALNLSEFLLRPIAALSSGQKQKTILAESLALSPSLLILDEPSANLDPLSVKELAASLLKLKEQGLSILITDHHRRWMEGGLADKIAILNKGEIVFYGESEEADDPVLMEKWGLRPGPGAPVKTRDALQERSFDPNQKKPHGTVSVKDLEFSYPKSKKLFTSLSLDLYPGEVTAITGPNGAGKTTLLRLISGLLSPDKGSILFSGNPIKERERLSRSAVAMQNADRQLVMSTVSQEIQAALNDPDPERAEQELNSWNLIGLSQRHPQSLSGGEKQRLALTSALARKSDILLLDEPTSGLDGKNLAMVAEAIKKASITKPVFLITHDVDLLEKTEARIIALSPPED
jgi:energy-coupling factor transport system ATP-binding protein